MVASLEWLSQELVKQQTKVEDSERAMAQYREDQKALSLEERQNIVVARLNQLNDAVTKAKTNRVQKEALYDQIKALAADVSADTIPAILQNAYIQTIKTRLAELQRERATLLERYGEKYPEVVEGERQPPGCLAAAPDGARQGDRRHQERLSVGAGRGADARRRARRAEGRGDGPQSQERQLHRARARGRQQPASCTRPCCCARRSCR